MIRIFTARLALLLATALLVFTTAANADDIPLPDIGSPADAVLSKNDEAQLGRQIMHSIRMSGTVVEDPFVTEYINSIGHRIAAQTNDAGYDFNFFVVNDTRINAFALPGGYIGVHSALIEATRNEDELAGVLAHEIAHVTQRHIARAISDSKRQSILTTALMLGAMVAAAAGGNGQMVGSAVAVAQGSAMQQQINFTRANEAEADRVGIAAMADAGFNPYGMASFFEVISRLQPATPEMRTPEFLNTHPVTTDRIAEARNRARMYPKIDSKDSTNFGLVRARLIVNRYRTSDAAVVYFEQHDYAHQSNADRYGRAVAYQRAGRQQDAMKIYADLLAADPKVIAYHIGLGETQLAMELYDRSEQTFSEALELFPRNVPLVLSYGKALLQLGRPQDAHNILLDLMNNVTPTPEQVQLLARAASEAGQNAEAYYYLAEYRFMTGDLLGGIGYLRQALALPELQEIQRIRFEARIDFIREYMSEEQLKQMQRAGPVRASARNIDTQSMDTVPVQ